MCIFQPGVLIEYKRGKDSVKVLICFKCQDMKWSINDREDYQHGVGLSDFAIMTVKAVLRESFPGNRAFL